MHKSKIIVFVALIVSLNFATTQANFTSSRSQTTLQADEVSITFENASQLALLDRVGRGDLSLMYSPLSFSNDSSQFAVATGAGVWLHQYPSGDEIGLLETPSHSLNSVSFSQDGRYVAAASVTSYLTQDATFVWDIESKELIHTFDSTGSFVRFSRDGNYVFAAASYDGNVHVWDMTAGDEHTAFQVFYEIRDIDVIDDATAIFTTFDTVQLWDFTTAEQRFEIPIEAAFEGSAALTSGAVSPNGTVILVGDTKNTVHVVNTAAQAETASVVIPGEESVAFSDIQFVENDRAMVVMQGTNFAENVGGAVWQIDLTTNTATEVIPGGPVRTISSAAIAPDGSGVLVHGGGELALRDLTSGETMFTLDGYALPSGPVSFLSNEEVLVGETRLSTNPLEIVTTYSPSTPGHAVGFLDFAIADETFALSYSNNLIDVRDKESGELLQSFVGAMYIDIHPTGQAVVGVDAFRVRSWDVASGERIWQFENPLEGTGSERQIRHAVIAQDGQIVVAISATGDIWLLDANDGTVQRNIKADDDWSQTQIMGTSLDGQMVAFDGGESINLLDVESGEILQTLTSEDTFIRDFAFSPDGSLLIFTNDHGQIGFWSLASDETVMVDTPFRQSDIAISPDGTHIVTTLQSGQVALWGILSK